MPDSTRTYLDFERPVGELEKRIEGLKAAAAGAGGVNVSDEVRKLEDKAAELLRSTYDKLDAWQKTQVARHPERPHAVDYITRLTEDFVELHGDRRFGDDAAIVGGTARFDGRPVVVIGTEKGRTTEARLKRNFGMARPEGYRKAIRLMDLAARFDLPVLTFVDTAGAYPGIGAEERGQAEAIARAIERCLTLPTPILAVITGEGGSGGAVALASANRVLMLEHSVYSVISPEGCASILWRDAAKARDAAVAMRITAKDLLGFKIADQIVPEPPGGAHRDPEAAIAAVGAALRDSLANLDGLGPDALRAQREARFLAIGREGLP